MEATPGVKDRDKMERFVFNAHAAFRGRVRLVSDAGAFMGDPDERGRFGDFGGRFVPEALVPACVELEAAFIDAWNDETFVDEYRTVLREFAGRPTPVTPLARLGEHLGLRIFAKREDLAHTGSHKINNVIGQTLLTKRMGKRRVIAETGAGQHGVATATAAARLGLECTVFMGEVDTERQILNVFRMELLGSRVVPVTSGSRTLKDAVNEAMREWVTCVADTHYCIGSVMGPHPFPWMVREFQSIIGREAAVQLEEFGVDGPRRRGRLRRRRIQRRRHLRRFRQRLVTTRGHRGRRWIGRRQRLTGCPARHAIAPDARRVRPDRGGALNLGRS